jgi:hypothetical protein
MGWFRSTTEKARRKVRDMTAKHKDRDDKPTRSSRSFDPDDDRPEGYSDVVNPDTGLVYGQEDKDRGETVGADPNATSQAGLTYDPEPRDEDLEESLGRDRDTDNDVNDDGTPNTPAY